MFAKAFRVKSNTAIKGSDRRKLRADVTTAFPTLGTDQVSALVPGKEELNVVKLYAHRGDAVTVYVCGGNPILFELEKNLYPTDGILVGSLSPLLSTVPIAAAASRWNRRGLPVSSDIQFFKYLPALRRKPLWASQPPSSFDIHLVVLS